MKRLGELQTHCWSSDRRRTTAVLTAEAPPALKVTAKPQALHQISGRDAATYSTVHAALDVLEPEMGHDALAPVTISRRDECISLGLAQQRHRQTTVNLSWR